MLVEKDQGLARVQDALDEQKVELLLLRHQLDSLKSELVCLK